MLFHDEVLAVRESALPEIHRLQTVKSIRERVPEASLPANDGAIVCRSGICQVPRALGGNSLLAINEVTPINNHFPLTIISAIGLRLEFTHWARQMKGVC